GCSKIPPTRHTKPRGGPAARRGGEGGKAKRPTWPPHLPRGKGRPQGPNPPPAPPEPVAQVRAPAPVAMVSPQERELRVKLKELRDHLIKNAENVGRKFPEQARKMHYGEIEHHSIYGEASPEDAKELHEEGIEFHPLPVLPEERN